MHDGRRPGLTGRFQQGPARRPTSLRRETFPLTNDWAVWNYRHPALRQTDPLKTFHRS